MKIRSTKSGDKEFIDVTSLDVKCQTASVSQGYKRIT